MKTRRLVLVMLALALIPSEHASAVVPDVTIAMSDASFTPRDVRGFVDSATFNVLWNNGSAVLSHTATEQDVQLFDTGVVPAAGFGIVGLNTAGTFRYVCSFHPGMEGSISIPPFASATTVAKGVPFTLGWAFFEVPAGYNVDVQVRKPKRRRYKTFSLDHVTTDIDDLVTLGRRGKYRFRVRLQKTATGAVTPFSPPIRVRVT